MKQPFAPWVFDFADAVAAKAVTILKDGGWKAEPALDMVREAVHEAVLSTLPETHDDPDDNHLEIHQ